MIINCWKIDLLCLIFRKLYDHCYYLLSLVFTWVHAQWTISLVQPPNFKNPKLSFTHKYAHHFMLTEDHIVTLSERSLSGWKRAVSNPKWFEVASVLICTQPIFSSKWQNLLWMSGDIVSLYLEKVIMTIWKSNCLLLMNRCFSWVFFMRMY
jgi:hypothetical protein